MSYRDYKPVYGPYPELDRLRQDLDLMLQMLDHGQRRSGRSTRLVERMTGDSRVVVGVAPKRWMQDLLRKHGFNPDRVFSADPRKPLVDHSQDIMREGTYPTQFDHTWVTARFQTLVGEALGQIAWEMDQVNMRPDPDYEPRF